MKKLNHFLVFKNDQGIYINEGDPDGICSDIDQFIKKYKTKKISPQAPSCKLIRGVTKKDLREWEAISEDEDSDLSESSYGADSNRESTRSSEID